jgi:hypothetical protein
MKHPEGRTVSVPVHNRDIAKGTLQKAMGSVTDMRARQARQDLPGARRAGIVNGCDRSAGRHRVTWRMWSWPLILTR